MSEGVDLIDIYADEEFNQVRGSPAAPGGEQGASPRYPNVPRGTPRQWERKRERRGAERGRFGEGERPQGPALPVVPAGREQHREISVNLAARSTGRFVRRGWGTGHKRDLTEPAASRSWK